MSVGSNLQEMENVVTKGAAPAEPMTSAGIPVEDLGGPTPDNYRPDDDSAKLAEPKIKTVQDIVNAKAAAPDPRPDTMREESEEDEELDDVEAEAEEVEVEAEADTEEGEEETSEEEEVEYEEEYDVEEDVDALLAGEELSEEFQEKARTIFETAIKTRVSAIKEEMQAAYEVAITEEIEEIKAGLTERTDAYLEYVADEWFKENTLAIEHGLKTEMTESFLAGMKSLFEDHYVTIPDDKYNVLESMVDKLDEMESKLNEQIEKNVALNRRLAESVSDVIFAEVAEGLALSQKDKLAALAENVEFDSENTYRGKLVTLRESYFPVNTSAQRDDSDHIAEETIIEDVQQVSTIMETYLQTLGRVAKKWFLDNINQT